MKKPSAPARKLPEPPRRLNVTLEPDTLPLLDEWRKAQPDLPTRPEAVRRILAAAIRALPKGSKR